MLPSAGLMLQVTPVWLTPSTCAVNCCVWPALSVTELGETLMVTEGGVKVNWTEAASVGSATLVAVAVMV